MASDRDPFVARCARENLLDPDRAPQPACLVADARDAPVRAELLLLDPDRRVDGRRSLDPDRWSPTLARSLKLAGRHAGACLKLAPALDVGPWGEGPGRSLTWVSLGRELVELTLWTGVLAAPQEAAREVLALGEDGSRASFSGVPEARPALDVAAAAEVRWLANPDPALVRSGLLGALARTQDLAPLAPELAFLGGDREPDSPLLEARRVLGSSGPDRKHVRRMLAQHDVGPVEVWKRGHARSAEELQREFRGKGSLRGTLAVARLERGHRVYLLETPGGVSAN